MRRVNILKEKFKEDDVINTEGKGTTEVWLLS